MKISTGGPEGSPQQPPPSSSHAFTFQNPQGSHWRLVWSRHGTLLTPAHPLWPFESFQQDPLPGSPKIPTCAFPLSSSQRQEPSSRPASAPLLITMSLPKLTVGASIPNMGITADGRGSHPLFHLQAPDKIFPNSPSLLPPAPLLLHTERRLQHLPVLQSALLPVRLQTAIHM